MPHPSKPNYMPQVYNKYKQKLHRAIKRKLKQHKQITRHRKKWVKIKINIQGASEEEDEKGSVIPSKALDILMNPHPGLGGRRRERVTISGAEKTAGSPRGGIVVGEVGVGELSKGVEGEEREEGGEGGDEGHDKPVEDGGDCGRWGGGNGGD